MSFNLKNINQTAVIAFILLLFYASACERKAVDKEIVPEEIHFSVNPSLLGIKVVHDEKMFEFYVPKSLTRSDNILIDFEDKFKPFISDNIALSLLYLWTDSIKENFLSVSRVILNYKVINDPIEYYSEIIRKTDLFKSASKAKFLKDGMLISQFITSHTNYIIIKIIFQPRQNYLIQFDYIFNEKNYKQAVRSIESSIGSIKIL